jgi:hypothetical protein
MTVALIVVCLVGALLLIIGVAVILPVNLRVTLGPALAVEPRGLDVLLTLRRRIEVPLGQVTDVRVVPRSQTPRLGLRLPGANVPGVCTAGSYIWGGERTFWDVRRADRVLVIRCAAGAPYQAFVLEFAEPDLVASRVREALAH